MTDVKTETAPVKKHASKNLSVPQKAEAAALWRNGSMTLEELGKKFKKRPEAMSRMFKKMGVVRGAAVEEAIKKIADAAEVRMLSDLEETMKKIAQVKNEHFRMSGLLAKIAFSEIQRARTEKIDIAKLKDVMMTLKLAGDVIGNSRKELFAVLNVERFDEEVDPDDLPELTVRELTGGEISQLRNTVEDDEMGISSDSGEDMMPEDAEEGP